MPVTLAGPERTLRVTARPELVVGGLGSAKGASPKVWSAMAGNVMVCVSLVTVKLCVTGGAAAKTKSPAWLAVTLTVPTPMSVSVEPESVAGPVTV